MRKVDLCSLALFGITIALTAPGVSRADGNGGVDCKGLASQIKSLQQQHREIARKLTEKERDFERNRDTVAVHEGRFADVAEQRSLVMSQRFLQVGAAKLRLLEMVRESLNQKPEGELSHQEINAYLEHEVEEQKKSNLFLTSEDVREHQKNLETLKNADGNKARARVSVLEAEIESLQREVSKSEEPLVAARDQAKQAGCFEFDPDLLHPLKAGLENADQKKCDRLLELTKPAEKKYFEALSAEARVLREYSDAQFIDTAAKDGRVFEIAEKVLKQIKLELAVEKERVAVLEAAAKNPKARAELAPLADAPPGQGNIAYLKSQLERNMNEYNRVKNAAANFAKKSADDRREAMSGLENKKTALGNAVENARREYERAKEPFKKAGCKESFFATLSHLLVTSPFAKGHSRLWDGVPEFGNVGWPVQPYQGPPGPPPGTTR